MIPTSLRALAVGLALHAGAASAAGGTPVVDIAWPHPGATLQYRSCGCADACWVAELVATRRHVVEARLHCDCENLDFNARPRSAAAPLSLGRCTAINDSPDKFSAIRTRIEELVARPPP